jgi:hypothetical protein
VETAGKGNLQTRTYKQEIQLIQVARIGQAGRMTFTTRRDTCPPVITNKLHIIRGANNLLFPILINDDCNNGYEYCTRGDGQL